MYQVIRIFVCGRRDRKELSSCETILSGDAMVDTYSSYESNQLGSEGEQMVLRDPVSACAEVVL